MIKDAIILLSDRNGLMSVFGIPLVKRIFIILRQMEIKNIVIMGKPEFYDEITSYIEKRFIFYPVDDHEKIAQFLNGEMFSDKVIILKANHVIDKTSLKILIEGCNKTSCALISKSNEPIFITSPKEILPIVEALWKNRINKSILSSVKKIEGNSDFPFLVNGYDAVKKAEYSLIKALSMEKRDTDSFIARYFDRNISLFFTKRLVHTKITPNQITLVGMSIGLFGAFLLCLPYYWTQLIGSLLFLFCVIVDGMDGEVARLKLKESTFGHYLDIITDNIVHIAIFIGMGYGLYKRTDDQTYLYLIGVLLIGFGLCAISVYQCILKKDEKELRKSPFLIRLMSFLTNRDFAYLVAFLAIIDRLNWFFIMTAIGSYIFSALLWILSYWYKKNYPADSAA